VWWFRNSSLFIEGIRALLFVYIQDFHVTSSRQAFIDKPECQASFLEGPKLRHPKDLGCPGPRIRSESGNLAPRSPS
jgi:hypothetical protein